ncbi:tetratricopeptide repeat protein [Actinoplanes sp. NPDC051851]|uniref:tetratricopeptide repeat protein n=1 Tax=Actinoplanes sp. NPDC051851 TaxID=3154753 RepID=UPI00343D56FE
MGFSDEVRSAFRRGENEVVVRMSEAEIARARAAGDPAGEVEALYSLARVAIRGGDLPTGEKLAGQALEVALDSGDRALEERPRHMLAAVARISGDLLRARDLYRESIALNEALGNALTVNSEYHNLAFCELKLGNIGAARNLFTAGRDRVFHEGWTDFVPYVCLAYAALASAEASLSTASLPAVETDQERAAFLVGVTDAAFAALGQVPDPDDAADLALVRAAALEALGPTRFDEQHARGLTTAPRDALT